jgi:hypothetical protein
VEYQELLHSRRLLGLPLVDLEPPSPPLRRRLDQQGSFEETEPQETETDPYPRREHLILEEPTISDLGAEALGLYNPLITDLSTPIIVQVDPYECQVVSQATMMTNAATSLGNTHTPSMTLTTGGFPPPNQSSPIQTTMVSTTSTLSNGLIPSMTTITAPLTQSATGPSFSYRMPSFDTNYVLSYSTLQTLGLRVGSSNAPLQGSMGGTSSLYNIFPHERGHIPPSSPLLGGAHQHSVGPNINYSSSGEGSQGLPSYSMLVGSTLFSLFNAFGNNALLSAVVSAGGNPGFGSQNPAQGTIPA